MTKVIQFAVLAAVFSSCSSGIYLVRDPFNSETNPPAPDYSNVSFWAALPEKADAADSVPVGSGLRDEQLTAKADVFFIYPTIFTQQPERANKWNADAADLKLNEGIQTSTIMNQASIFNGCCRVYAPYYRQAHYSVFLTEDRKAAEQALNLAYEDVRNAFNYYLENFNSGRPIIIASHSQGSLHGERLLKEFFDGKPLQEKLVMAYLAGRAIKRDAFREIKPSAQPEQTGAWASWCTFISGYYPESYDRYYKEALAINPLTWNDGPGLAPKQLNKGGVGLKFKFIPQLVDAESHKGLLWINKPYVAGRLFIRIKNWHRADMNLFYANIRENARLRTEQYFRNTAVSGR